MIDMVKELKLHYGLFEMVLKQNWGYLF
jgi:hypothetical protein